MVQYYTTADGPPSVEGVRTSVQSTMAALGPLIAPDQAQVGVPFEVTIATYGGSGCIRPAPSEVQPEVSAASITPYDSLAVSPPCPAD